MGHPSNVDKARCNANDIDFETDMLIVVPTISRSPLSLPLANVVSRKWWILAVSLGILCMATGTTKIPALLRCARSTSNSTGSPGLQVFIKNKRRAPSVPTAFISVAFSMSDMIRSFCLRMIGCANPTDNPQGSFVGLFLDRLSLRSAFITVLNRVSQDIFKIFCNNKKRSASYRRNWREENSLPTAT